MHIRKAGIHILLWVIGISITSISSLIRFSQIPWEPFLYNHLSLIMVFYLTYLLVESYIQKVPVDDAMAIGFFGQCKYYLFRWEILGIILVLGGNVILSWRMDNHFFQVGYYTSMPANIWIYADGKFARESFYASMGAFYGLYRVTILRKNTTIEFQKQMIIIIKKENIGMKATITRLLKRLRGGLSND